MIEAEIPFIDDVNELCQLIEHFVRHFVTKLHESAQKELEIISGKDYDSKLVDFIKQPFINLPYPEAAKMILESGKTFSVDFESGDDLTKEHELFLVEQLKAPIFLTYHPANLKPFYMKRTDDCLSCLSVDLLLPNVAEVCGGSIRENCLQKLQCRLTAEQVSDLEWYVDLRRVGSFPHGGYGIGFDRLLQYSTGVRNIRDVVAFPRMMGSCKC